MSPTDRAIVVGVSCYPALGDLKGPENDAQAFYNWLTDPTGGDVPAGNIELIVSSAFGPPFPSETVAQPTRDRIEQVFDELDNLARANPQGLRVGRRLYLYFAGHGFAPPPQQQDKDAGLLMANATPRRTGYHILGRAWARHFLLAGYFDEVLLFMDCCREQLGQPPLNMPTHAALLATAAVDKTTYFYAFGAKLTRKARERSMPNGMVHGVFTSALLDALRGKAKTSTGTVTAASLGGYLFSHMRNYLAPEDLEDPDVAKEPDLEYHPVAGAHFVIASSPAPLPTFPVVLRLPPMVPIGKQIKILRNGDFALFTSIENTGDTILLQLPRGWYLAQIDGFGPQVITVDGGEEASDVVTIAS